MRSDGAFGRPESRSDPSGMRSRESRSPVTKRNRADRRRQGRPTTNVQDSCQNALAGRKTCKRMFVRSGRSKVPLRAAWEETFVGSAAVSGPNAPEGDRYATIAAGRIGEPHACPARTARQTVYHQYGPNCPRHAPACIPEFRTASSQIEPDAGAHSPRKPPEGRAPRPRLGLAPQRRVALIGGRNS